MYSNAPIQLNLGSGLIIDNNGQQLKPSSTSSTLSQTTLKADTDELGLKDDMLRKYMQENEGLRSENSQLHQQVSAENTASINLNSRALTN